MRKPHYSNCAAGGGTEAWHADVSDNGQSRRGGRARARPMSVWFPGVFLALLGLMLSSACTIILLRPPHLIPPTIAACLYVAGVILSGAGGFLTIAGPK